MTRARRALILTVGLALSLSASAFAVSATTVKDPKHDLLSTTFPTGVTAKDVDITQATAGKANGKIKLVISVVGAIANAQSDYSSSAAFMIKAPGPTYYTVYPSAAASGYSVFSQAATPGIVKVGYPDTHTVTFSFNPSAIGSPAKYHWNAAMGTCTIYDKAPDTGFASSTAKRC